MRNISKVGVRLVNAVVIFYMANLYSLGRMVSFSWLSVIGILYFLFINVMPSILNVNLKSKRLRSCGNGCELLILFLFSLVCTCGYSLIGFFGKLPFGSLTDNPGFWIIHTLLATLVEAVIFWNGIIRVYTTSVQLGIRRRVVGIVCGWIPVVNLIALRKIIHTVQEEVTFENDKLLLNEERKVQQICKTKYPILMVHGVFFRDYRYLNYWGRIPAELEKNGAGIYYGNHESAASIEDSAKELAERINQIIQETGCQKVNIIAHSKGGLDCRLALLNPDVSQYVASLTTINTPHQGCEFADYLLSKISKGKQEAIARTYNAALRRMGDKNPDFLAAVNNLTASTCCAGEEKQKVEGIYYQSIGSKLNVPSSGRFPLNFTCGLVHCFDGSNDGLVGEKSFFWGEETKQFLTVKGKRGISHGDMIDLNRENIPGFDVREFYVQLVSELKEKGL